MAGQFNRNSEYYFLSVIRTSFDMEREWLERQKPSNLMMLTEEMRSVDGKLAFPYGGGSPQGMKRDYGEGFYSGNITRDEWTARVELWVDSIYVLVEEMESEVGLRVVRSHIQKLAYQATIFPMVLMLQRLKQADLKWPVDDKNFFGTKGTGAQQRGNRFWNKKEGCHHQAHPRRHRQRLRGSFHADGSERLAGHRAAREAWGQPGGGQRAEQLCTKQAYAGCVRNCDALAVRPPLQLRGRPQSERPGHQPHWCGYRGQPLYGGLRDRGERTGAEVRPLLLQCQPDGEPLLPLDLELPGECQRGRAGPCGPNEARQR